MDKGKLNGAENILTDQSLPKDDNIYEIKPTASPSSHLQTPKSHK